MTHADRRYIGVTPVIRAIRNRQSVQKDLANRDRILGVWGASWQAYPDRKAELRWPLSKVRKARRRERPQ